MADQTLTFSLDTGDGADRDVVIKLKASGFYSEIKRM